MPSALTHRTCALLLVTLLAVPAAAAAQSGTGIVQGRVIDTLSGQALAGATVAVKDTAVAAVTDADGSFSLSRVPAGSHVLVVTYLGRRDQEVEIQVEAGAILTEAIAFSQPYVYREDVKVGADLIVDAQARALNQQKNALDITNVVSADQIGAFPDSNAAETTQRIPGVTITKDQGEGRYVSIRGTEPRLNAMMIDGERIPAPDPLLRQVALDVVPSELLQVHRGLEGADARHGCRFDWRQREPRAQGGARAIPGCPAGSAAATTVLQDSYKQNNYSVTAGGRFADGRAGAIVSVAGSETNRANNDVEVSYTPALGIADFDPRYYEVNRRRVGFTGAVDVTGQSESPATRCAASTTVSSTITNGATACASA